MCENDGIFTLQMIMPHHFLQNAAKESYLISEVVSAWTCFQAQFPARKILRDNIHTCVAMQNISSTFFQTLPPMVELSTMAITQAIRNSEQEKCFMYDLQYFTRETVMCNWKFAAMPANKNGVGLSNATR